MFAFFNKKNEAVKVRFFIDQNTIEERMTWKYQKLWKKITNKEGSDEDIQKLLGRFMVDEQNRYIDDDQKVIRMLDELTSSQIVDTFQKFTEAFQNLLSPKVSGSGLSSPSEVGRVETLPIGQQR